MAIRVVVFDIGGIFEQIPEGGDPTERIPRLLARWDAQTGHPEGTLKALFDDLGARWRASGKDGELGTLTEDELRAGLAGAAGWDQPRVDAFMRDFWDIYCGGPNPDLAAYFAGLRPRYRTALLSNSFDGARREEETRFRFSVIADPIIYSHEVGIAKPDPRIYALTCERVGAHPGEIIFLDDSERNVAAACAFGIHGVLYHDNAQAIAAIDALLRTHAA